MKNSQFSKKIPKKVSCLGTCPQQLLDISDNHFVGELDVSGLRVVGANGESQEEDSPDFGWDHVDEAFVVDLLDQLLVELVGAL